MSKEQILLCVWCESILPKKPWEEKFCSKNCYDDSLTNNWPSWMGGRIGRTPSKEFHTTGDFLCLSAPNKYRQIYRKKDLMENIQKIIIDMQKKDFPNIPNPEGLNIDFPSWDQVIIWRKNA